MEKQSMDSPHAHVVGLQGIRDAIKTWSDSRRSAHRRTKGANKDGRRVTGPPLAQRGGWRRHVIDLVPVWKNRMSISPSVKEIEGSFLSARSRRHGKDGSQRLCLANAV